MASNPAPFVLASVLASYPWESASGGISALLEDDAVELPDGLREMIRERIAHANIPDLQSEYISIFDSGRDANPIYETGYDRRRAMAKGNELSDIAGFYKAFGFELDSSLEGMDMPDHAGIELEFYALMLMKEIHLSETGDAAGAGIVSDAAAKFLKAHLGRFIGSIARRPGVDGSGFYGPVFRWCAQLVAEECKRREIEVIQADWVDAEALKDEELNCAAASDCAVSAAPKAGPDPAPPA
jgi:nitrate reductase assembly molybdenum cofactor insertion protein NarJ